MKTKSYNNFFMSFANNTKLDIILALKDMPLSVNEITGITNSTQSNISHHLKDLTSCNIIAQTKKGKQRIYSLNKETVIPILKLVEKHISKNCFQQENKICNRCLHGG